MALVEEQRGRAQLQSSNDKLKEEVQTKAQQITKQEVVRVHVIVRAEIHTDTYKVGGMFHILEDARISCGHIKLQGVRRHA